MVRVTGPLHSDSAHGRYNENLFYLERGGKHFVKRPPTYKERNPNWWRGEFIGYSRRALSPNTNSTVFVVCLYRDMFPTPLKWGYIPFDTTDPAKKAALDALAEPALANNPFTTLNDYFSYLALDFGRWYDKAKRIGVTNKEFFIVPAEVHTSRPQDITETHSLQFTNATDAQWFQISEAASPPIPDVIEEIPEP